MFLVVRWSIPNIPDHLVPNLRIPNHLVPNLVPKTKPRVRHLRVRQHLFRGVNRRVGSVGGAEEIREHAFFARREKEKE